MEDIIYVLIRGLMPILTSECSIQSVRKTYVKLNYDQNQPDYQTEPEWLRQFFSSNYCEYNQIKIKYIEKTLTVPKLSTYPIIKG